MKLDPFLISTKINWKWVKDLNLRIKTINLYEESISVNIHDFGFSNGFLNMTPKAKTKVKNKTDKLDLFKIQNLCFKGHSQ